MLDLAAVRRSSRRSDRAWIFFDNAGGSQILGSAAERVADFFRTSYVQLGGSYALSQLAGERVADGAAGARPLARLRPGGGRPRHVDDAAPRQPGAGDGAADRSPATRSSSPTSTTSRTSAPGAASPPRAAPPSRSGASTRDTLLLRAEDLERAPDRQDAPRLLHARLEPRRQRPRRRRHHAPRPRARRPRPRRRRGLRAAPPARRARLGRRLLRLQRLQDLRPAPGVPLRQARAPRRARRREPLLHRRDALQAAARPRPLRAGGGAPRRRRVPASGSTSTTSPRTSARWRRACSTSSARVRGVRVLGERTASATRLPTVSFTVDGAHAADIVRAVDRTTSASRAATSTRAVSSTRLGLSSRGGVIRASLVHYNSRRRGRPALRRARAYPDSGASRLTLKRRSLVEPAPLDHQPGRARQPLDLGERVLVARLGVDALAVAERHRRARARRCAPSARSRLSRRISMRPSRSFQRARCAKRLQRRSRRRARG